MIDVSKRAKQSSKQVGKQPGHNVAIKMVKKAKQDTRLRLNFCVLFDFCFQIKRITIIENESLMKMTVMIIAQNMPHDERLV